VLIYLLFKLRHLLHDRIDPTVELLRKQPPNLKRKRTVQNNKNDELPPIGTPDWCLNIEALEKLGRSDRNIPNYDPDDDNPDDNISEDRPANYDNNSDRDNSESSKSRKEKKRKKKVNKHKTKKSKKK
jgi:hypothetical protein